MDEGMKIPFCDLAGDHQPLLGELEAAAGRVIRSGRFILGPEVAAFERELAAAAGVAHAVGLSSGTDALIAMLMAAGVAPGDEVVTSPFSFFATAEAVARVGARPVFADVDPTTLNLDPARAIEALGARTRAVLVVHLFGRIGETEALAEACAARGIPLLEDAAQAIGAHRADGGRPGALGTGAALSFFPTKNLGGFGDGGAVLTNDAAFADRIRRLRVHGADRKNHHVVVGGNFRLDELQAALLRVKLPHLPRWSEARRAIALAYREGLADVPLALPPEDRGAAWNQFVVRVSPGHRDALANRLGKEGVATEVYYPLPLPHQPALAHLGSQAGAFPACERAAAEVLALPIFPSLSRPDVDRITAIVSGYFSGFFEGAARASLSAS
jgi:dTDP-4-amino-4,6-dideoxygalactose transaminase